MKKEAVAVLVNDIHINKENDELIKDIFRQINDVCDKYDTSNIIVGGDIFTNRSGQPLQCLTTWKEVLDFVNEKDKHIYVIPGNHDKTDNNDEKSYLDVYSNPCMTLFRNAKRKFFSGCAIAFIPYFGDEKWLENFETIEETFQDDLINHDITSKTPIFLITHTGFDGVINNDGSKVESIIKPSMFKAYTVLIGHYHNASELLPNVRYTGSAYQNDFGENSEDKGFTVLFDDGSTKFVHSTFPRYIKETVKANDRETLSNLIEKYDGEKINHIRIIIEGKKTDFENINVSDIQSKGIDVKFESNETKEAIEVSEDDNVLSYDKKTIMKNFLHFCSEGKIVGKKLKFGLNLVKNVESC